MSGGIGLLPLSFPRYSRPVTLTLRPREDRDLPELWRWLHGTPDTEWWRWDGPTLRGPLLPCLDSADP